MAELAGIEARGRARLVELLRGAGTSLITVDGAVGVLRLPRIQAAKMMARWAAQGWLTRVRRGLYAPVTLRARRPGETVEDPWAVAAEVFKPCYLGGWTAAEYWGFTEQIFRTVVVMSRRPVNRRRLKIQATEFLVKRVAEGRFFGTKTVWRGKTPVLISDPTKTLVDILDDPTIGGGARLAGDMLAAYLAAPARDLGRLVQYAERVGNGAIFKRLGYLLDITRPQAVDQEFLSGLRTRLTWGNAKLDPSLPANRLVTRWRLWVPAPAKEVGRD